jgi:hypothetical protein
VSTPDAELRAKLQAIAHQMSDPNSEYSKSLRNVTTALDAALREMAIAVYALAEAMSRALLAATRPDETKRKGPG